jgi:hypothetical protein
LQEEQAITPFSDSIVMTNKKESSPVLQKKPQISMDFTDYT